MWQIRWKTLTAHNLSFRAYCLCVETVSFDSNFDVLWLLSRFVFHFIPVIALRAWKRTISNHKQNYIYMCIKCVCWWYQMHTTHHKVCWSIFFHSFIHSPENASWFVCRLCEIDICVMFVAVYNIKLQKSRKRNEHEQWNQRANESFGVSKHYFECVRFFRSFRLSFLLSVCLCFRISFFFISYHSSIWHTNGKKDIYTYHFTSHRRDRELHR